MKTDIRENKPWSLNEIKTEKPNVEKTETLLSGFTGGSFNAGHDKTIHYRQIMAGQRIKQAWWEGSIKLLTPKTPAYQNLICTARSYFVPNVRVWKNYDKFQAYKGGSSEEKIAEIPNLRGKKIPIIYTDDDNNATTFDNTAYWRDTFISSYLPRTSEDEQYETETEVKETPVAPISVLALRGRVAIYNDKERNKMYEERWEEFTDSDTVSDREWNNYIANSKDKYSKLKMRSRAAESYYTNYRTEIQGLETEQPEMSSDQNLINWTNWENLTDFARKTVNDSEKNDWDIIAELRGSKKAVEGQVQLIGKHSFVLNYNSITQSTYNTKNNIEKEYQVMGAQGGYSYTYVKIPLYAGQEFTQDGYIHTIFTISADTVYTNAYPRMELNIGIMDRYRPDLAEQKQDVLYYSECGVKFYHNGNNNISNDWSRIYGFKRKFSEYFKLENNVNADILNLYTFDYPEATEYDNRIDIFLNTTAIQPQNTYTFFEESKDLTMIRSNYDENFIYQEKKVWKDYSDIQINKNQAIPNRVVVIDNGENFNEYAICGNNQAVYIGKIVSEDIIPINSDIKNDFTKWGEH